jgi:phosphonopyruvate decarboxylase
MIDPSQFTKKLIKNNLGPIVEVPCSYLKSFLNYLWDSKKIEIINPVNEAVAMGMASGFYLGTRKIPVVAIQNSGLMNTLNALTSLNQIYKIPIFYLITWRGEKGKGKDAPEHDILGESLEKILMTFKIPYEVIDEESYSKQLKELSLFAKKTKNPVALIIRKDTFSNYEKKRKNTQDIELMTRPVALAVIKNIIGKNALYLSSTGFSTRDSFSIYNTPDFYMVGSMGHAFAIALGLSPNTNKKIVVLEGDGSMFMHLGSLASFKSEQHKNIIYVVLDNESYESTGGQETTFKNIKLVNLAKLFGFESTFFVKDEEKLKTIARTAFRSKKSSFIHIKIKQDCNFVSKRVSDKYTTEQIKDRFISALKV